MHLRPYQTDLITGTRAAFAAGSRRVLLASPTGSGKTVTGAALVSRYVERHPGRVLWLAHRGELLSQARDTLGRLRLNPGLIAASRSNPAPNSRVQVASVSTAARRSLDPFDLVVIDEAHRSSAKSYRHVVEHTAPRFLVGLTATPARTDGRPLGEVYDALVIGPRVADLVEAGHLAPARYYAAPFHLEKVRKTAGDYNRRDLAAAMTRSALVGDIVPTWQKHAAGRSTIAFAAGVEHAEIIAESFRAAGVAAASVSGTTPKPERRRMIADLGAGRLTVLANADVLVEGVDVPRVSCIIGARPTMSAIIYRQAVGRGLRTHPGKVDAVILDHAGWLAAHGHIYEPVVWTLEGKKAATRPDEPFAIWTCPECYAVHEGAPAAECPACLWQRPAEPLSRTGPDQRDGELQEVSYQATRRPKAPPAGWYLARVRWADQYGPEIQVDWEILDEGESQGYCVMDTLSGAPKVKARILHLMRAIGHNLAADRQLSLAAEDLRGQRAYVQISYYKRKAQIAFAGFRKAA